MTSPIYDFSGTRALVTGAGRGIGRAVASAFAASGAEVYALDLSFDTAPTDGIHHHICDITDTERMRALVANLIHQQGPITTLVNNAGSDRRMAFADMSDADWRWMLDVNLFHYTVFSQTVAPSMAAAGPS